MSKLNVLLAGASALALLPSVAGAEDQVTDSDQGSVQTVVVTASPIGGNPDRFATIVGKVSRDDILESGGANLADALSRLPGVTGSSFAAGASRPVIRGFDANRVRMLEDGVGSFDVSDIGPDHGVPIDPLAAQGIEVVRGPATLRYGSQAIGGVVNVINSRVPTTLAEKPFDGEASAAYSTVAASGEGSLLGDGRIGNLALHADGFMRHTSSYDTPLGEVPNSDFRGDGYSAGGSYFFTPQSRIGGAIIHYDAKYGIPNEDAFIDMRQTKELVRSSFDIGVGPLRTLSVDGGYASYRHDEKNNADDSVNSTFVDKEWDSRAEIVFGQMGFLSAAALGAQIQRRDFSALGEGASYLLPTHTNNYAAFAFAETPLASVLHLQIGARIENVTADGTPVTNVPGALSFTPVSGSIGVLYDMTPSTKLGLTLSSASRAPAVTELFARGAHDGPGTFETGDPALGIERANSLEASLRVRYSRTDFEGSLWGARYDDFIYGFLTGSTCDEDGNCTPGNLLDFKELLYRQHDARFYGAEAKLSIAALKLDSGNVVVDALADLVHAEFTEGLGNVPRIPPYRIGAGVSYEADSFDGGIMLIYSGRQDDLAFAETPTKSFASLDAHLAWRPLGPDGVEFAIVGHNLTNDVQRNHVAFNKDEVVLPGRDIRFIVRMAI